VEVWTSIRKWAYENDPPFPVEPRFKSSDKLAAYIGLTPSEFSSGHLGQGKITHCGNTRVRACLVESSWILIAKDPFMRKRYQELKNRKGGKKAIVAIARMLIIRVRRILLDNEPYLLKAA
jgi:transposase